MASRETGYGLTAELTQKKDGKFDVQLAKDAFNWINQIVPDARLPQPRSQDDVTSNLKDGVILCKLANTIKTSGAPIKINTGKMAFKQMENIGNFLSFCGNVGMLQNDLFQTVDLYEGQNIPLVISALHALGRKAPTVNSRIPGLGPKEASKNPRTFTEEQKRSGDAVIGLQMGTNRGANQSGINFGLGRQIK